MRSPFRITLLVAGLLVALTSSPTRAVAQASDAEAKDEYDRGYRALQAGQYEAAVLHYQRSYELVPRPRTLFNLALAEERLGRREDAARHLAQFIEQAEPRDAEFVAQAKAELETLATSAAAPPPPVVEPVAPPPPPPPPPSPLASAAGRCEPARGLVRVRSSEPGASVTIDGVVIGVTVDRGDGAMLRYPIAAGEHEIVIERDGGAAWRQRVAAGDGEVLEIGVELDRGGGARGARWGLTGLGVASLASGGVLGVLALRDAASSDLDRHPRGKTRALITDALFLVGGAAIYGASRLAPTTPPPRVIVRRAALAEDTP
ncbi:MAG TPA: PEGA domain-containing protein [Kofleriaceae bacterium]|nr:PEGA domain-containing protein [Kofleriaceae bacterium]